MHTERISSETLASSVIAVPPMARNDDLTFNRSENQKLIRYLEDGGVSTLLYGGNAVLYHVRPSEYAQLLQMLNETAGPQTWMIPSVGPSYGVMMDQAEVLKDFEFPTAMVLPQRDITTSAGVATGVRHFAEAVGAPAVLYIKHDGYIDVADVRRLADDNVYSWIKYAVVRDDTGQDPYLRELVDAVGPDRIVSGIGEQPAIIHLREFGLRSFTSGCVCAAPQLSMDMLRAIQQGDWATAEQIRETFRPLEDLRNEISPIRVLQAAVTAAEIADMGPLPPLLTNVDESRLAEIEAAARELTGAVSSA